MRLLIGQDIGLPDLLPLALDVLRDNPMSEGDMHEGDLLSAILTRNPAIWAQSPELGRELRVIVSESTDLPPDLQQKVDRLLTSWSTDTEVAHGWAKRRIYGTFRRSGRGPDRAAGRPRVRRRTMMPIITQRIMVSERSGLVSKSRARRRCVVSHEKGRSIARRLGRTSKPRWPGSLRTMSSSLRGSGWSSRP
ncbi:contact-dependent growth inhibition system immunity protein [Streptomyces sp. P17]|uniref:contact-dependent growth inhibition system immunity protein n=1 Tax=Streptomyces sp. P17 TaxID=3074716 RepID=UPI0028F3E4F1|nr:contact-dependent growth inhibition system immunity protein [Streptomyces sp. P17]MDT9700954.1 contact-dependent growth inhibition system immunity protein [Streptomyces sp. P17]